MICAVSSVFITATEGKFSQMMFSGVWAEAGQSYCGSQIDRQLSLIGPSYLSARYDRQWTYLSVPITDDTVNGGDSRSMRFLR